MFCPHTKRLKKKKVVSEVPFYLTVSPYLYSMQLVFLMNAIDGERSVQSFLVWVRKLQLLGLTFFMYSIVG